MYKHEHFGSNCLDDCVITQALSGLSIGLVLTRPPDKIMWMNRSAERILACKGTESLGRALGGVLRDAQLRAFWESASAQEGSVLADVSVQVPTRMSLKLNACGYTDASGRRAGRALLIYDVTAERAIQLELSEAVAARFLSMTDPEQRGNPELDALTRQELRLLALVGRGLSNDEIAAEMAIRTSTVRSHLKSIYKKLDITSRTEAVSYAARINLA
jgi:DNA-binding NarL/FixJ family response regulator